MKMIGKNTNTASEANHDTVPVGSSTAVVVLPALPQGQQIWSVIDCTNNGNRSLWVRKRPAASDNDKNGIRVAPGETVCLANNSEAYTGEISAIFENGPSRDVFMEYF